MTNRIPWSVKGIHPEAREAAKRAARRAGVTLGEWLNGLIYEADGDGVRSPGRGEGLTRGEIFSRASAHREQADQDEIIDAVETIAHRIDRLEQRNDRTLIRIDDVLSDAATRLHAVESAPEPVGELKVAVAQLAEYVGASQVKTKSKLDEAMSGVADMREETRDALQKFQESIDRLNARLETTAAPAALEARNADDDDILHGLETRIQALTDEMARNENRVIQLETHRDRDAPQAQPELSREVAEIKATLAGQSDRIDEIVRTHMEQAVQAALSNFAERAAHSEERAAEQLRDSIVEAVTNTALPLSAAGPYDNATFDSAGELDVADEETGVDNPLFADDIEDQAFTVLTGHGEKGRFDDGPTLHNSFAEDIEEELEKALADAEYDAPETAAEDVAARNDLAHDDAPGGVADDITSSVLDDDDELETPPAFGRRVTADLAPADDASDDEAADDALEQAENLRAEHYLSAARQAALAASGDRDAPARKTKQDKKEKTRDRRDRGVRAGPRKGVSKYLSHVALGCGVILLATGAYVVFAGDDTPALSFGGGADAAAFVPTVDRSASATPAADQPLNTRAAFEKGAAMLEAASDDAARSDAVELIMQAAYKNYAPAQFALAQAYHAGNGVARDASAAERWYERAAQAGNVKAMHMLAVFHARGDNGGRDMARAAQWFERAAELDFTDAQYNLGVLYEQGDGVVRDEAQAYFWYGVAARNGDTDAETRARVVASVLRPDDLRRANRLIDAWRANDLDATANGLDEAPASESETSLVSEAQDLLAQLGFDPGPADGYMGPQTADAVRQFELQTGLPETGRVSTTLVERLKASAQNR